MKPLQLLCLLVIFCVQPQLAGAGTWNNVTLKTTGGWTYEDVTVEYSSRGQVAKIVRADGSHKTVTRSNIRLITDSRGKDITRLVLSQEDDPAASADTLESPVSAPFEQDEPPPRPVTAAGSADQTARGKPILKDPLIFGNRFRFSIAGGIGYGTSAGDWFEGLTSGVAFHLAGRVVVGDNVYLGLSYRYQDLGLESQFQQIDGVNLEVNLGETFVLIGWISQPTKPSTPFVFSEAGIGAVNHRFKGTLEGTSASASTNEVELGLYWGAGLLFPISKGVGVQFDGNMRLTGSGDSNTSSSGFLFGISGGLVLMLGQ